ncbi:MAG: hypothetical protein WAN48_12735 [Actinomycetes bacterium]
MTLVSPHALVDGRPRRGSDSKHHGRHDEDAVLRHPDLVAVLSAAFALAALVTTVLPFALVCAPLLALVAVATGLSSLFGSGHGHRLGHTVAVIGVVGGSVVLVATFAVLLLMARLSF